MTRPKAARRPFAMNEEFPFLPVDEMAFRLTGIVGYVIQQHEFRFWHDFRERDPKQMRDDLAVCQSAIRGCPHGTEIPLAEVRSNRCTGQFPIGNLPIALCEHGFQEIRSHLMAETSRSAMDAHDNIVQAKPEHGSGLRMKDFGDLLHFQVMVP